jgi:Na+-transporting NADH:ubiquinone oxidoreductase subunit A
LNGHTANNWAAYIGRFHNQVSVIAEGTEREFMGWIRPAARTNSLR